MNMDRRARWAISFADLALLLLGFFVLLQASGKRSEAVLSGVSRQFGGKPVTLDQAQEFAASGLFERDEAMLTSAGAAKLAAVGKRFAAQGFTVELISQGQDATARRFDAWDLSAARLGAVARALRSAGIPENRLVIRGLDQEAADEPGQVIRIAPGKKDDAQ
jgi:flagellar motor protein MotB